MIPDWEMRTDAALDWALRSNTATGNQGSSHSYSPIFGWAKAYPETSGYLIETLLAYARLKNRPELQQTAYDLSRWLCVLQLPSGAFPGLLVGNTTPSIFNTGQILFGLQATIQSIQQNNAFQTDVFLQNLAMQCVHTQEKAAKWLFEMLEPNGSWEVASYVKGFSPSYYTRVILPLLQIPDVQHNPALLEQMNKALHFYAKRFTPQNSVRDWGFHPKKPAFTHTIAYTLEGFLESALLLNQPSILEKTLASMEHLLDIRQKVGRTAGSYSEHWVGDYTFRCLTGNAQLSIIYGRAGQITGDKRFQQAAVDFLTEILPSQYLQPHHNAFGGLPGSAPFWGKYLRFRYPNWAVKFFLDAMIGVQKNFQPK